MWLIQVTLDELGTSYSLVISVILANRLMISVRSTYYQSEASIAQMPSIAFNNVSNNVSRNTFPLDEGAGAEIELDRFDAQHGF
jgi:hypothetical protein